MALDADDFDQEFVKLFADECPLAGGDAIERVFLKEGGERFGAYVSLPRTEYEFGKCTASSLVCICQVC